MSAKGGSRFMSSVTLAAVGDILIWRRQLVCARRPGGHFDFTPLFFTISPILKKATITVGNLETPLAGREVIYHHMRADGKFPAVNSPDELALALKRAGFTLVSTANNHALDRGRSGLDRTLRVLRTYGLRHVGSGSTPNQARLPAIMGARGIRFAFLAYTYGTNIQLRDRGPVCVNTISLRRLAADIAKVRTRVDVVVVCLHFGREFSHTPSGLQRRIVQVAVRSGADIILGAHPHVLQPVRTLWTRRQNGAKKKVVVAYSLGDFVTERLLNRPDTIEGTVLFVQITKGMGTPARITRAWAVPTWVHHHRLKGRPSGFRVVPVSACLKRPGRSVTQKDLAALHLAWLRSRQVLGKAVPVR
jgi:poly-gamma-glutamate synthesis protein (capsule biosynthesis protein)